MPALLEVWFLHLDSDGAVVSEPGPSLSAPLVTDMDSTLAALLAARGIPEDQVVVSESTSWRFEWDSVLLITYIVVLAGDEQAGRISQPVDLSNPVVEHGIRHLRSLYEANGKTRRLLGGAWGDFLIRRPWKLAVKYRPAPLSAAPVLLEVWMLGLMAGTAVMWEPGPLTAGPLTAGPDPTLAALLADRRFSEHQVVIKHSTSWRFEKGGVVLSYVVVLTGGNPRRDAHPVDLSIPVLEHAFRHMRFLCETDGEIRRSLGEGWEGFLMSRQPALAGRYRAWRKRPPELGVERPTGRRRRPVPPPASLAGKPPG